MRPAEALTLENRIEALCRSALGVSPCAIVPIEAGLGSRRFFRVEFADSDRNRDRTGDPRTDPSRDPGSPPGDAPASLIARCEMPEDPALRPPGVKPEPPLEPIRALLEANGLPVPRRYAADESADTADIELLEDAGDVTLDALAARADSTERNALYALAADWIPRLQAIEGDPARVPNFARSLDAALLDYKADQVCQWLVPYATGKPATAAETRVVADAFGEIKAAVAAAPQRLAHRDYKAQNLHVLGGTTAPRLMMIDLQGAFLAPPEYDLVCLLRDLQFELSREEVHAQRERIRPALPDAPSRDEFEHRFELLTLSRVGKDLARYLYAIHERGDERYRQYLPTPVRHLRDAATASAPWSRALARFADLIASLPEPPCAQ